MSAKRFPPTGAMVAALVLNIGLLLSLAAVTGPAAAKEYPEITWTELMPEEDLRLLEQMPEITHDSAGAPSLPPELMEGRVVPELDGRDVRIPGFVVPLEVTEDRRIIEFFLVPYYGACIHVPPPPPNQIIHVRYPEGFSPDALYDAFWISGTLRTGDVSNDLAESSYVMEAESVILYEE